LMVTEEGPKVLEYNVRFGDPEAQALLPRLKSDLAELLLNVVEGKVPSKLTWDPRPCVCVVLAAPGYPVKPKKGQVITGLEQVEKDENVVVFHAGTQRQDNQWVTSGGRVLNVVALGDNYQEAIDRAYQSVAKIQFEGMHYRKDIAARALTRPLAV